MATTLSAQSLHIGYTLGKGAVKSVHEDLRLELESGQVTALLGLNGAGKSTLLRTLCGFQPALSGSVELLGRALSSYSKRELSRMVGVVLTEKTNAGGISVYDLVSLGRQPYTGFFGSLSDDDHKIVEQSLQAVGIDHKAQNFVSELSDGERQKVMIAKALAQQCPIIVLDEPTAFLDVISRVETMVLLRELAHNQNKTILLSTHDLDMAIQMCDSMWLLEKGKPMCCGVPEDLILGGKLDTFFSRKDISFDSLTGRLATPLPTQKIGLEGHEQTTRWVANALLRKGFLPSEISPEYTSITCNSHNDIVIAEPGENPAKVESIAELIATLEKA